MAKPLSSSQSHQLSHEAPNESLGYHADNLLNVSDPDLSLNHAFQVCARHFLLVNPLSLIRGQPAWWYYEYWIMPFICIHKLCGYLQSCHFIFQPGFTAAGEYRLGVSSMCREHYTCRSWPRRSGSCPTITKARADWIGYVITVYYHQCTGCSQLLLRFCRWLVGYRPPGPLLATIMSTYLPLGRQPWPRQDSLCPLSRLHIIVMGTFSNMWVVIRTWIAWT